MTSVPRSLRWTVLSALRLAPAAGCTSSSTTKGDEGPKVSKGQLRESPG